MPRASAALPAVQPSDISIAGDPLALPHLLADPPEHPATVAEFAGLARTIAADRRQLGAAGALRRHLPLVRPAAHRTAAYEVWLLSWVPGQGSGLHDHGRSCGVLTVLRGALTEHTATAAGRAGDAGGRRAAGLRRRDTSTRWSTTRWSRRSACTSTSRA